MAKMRHVIIGNSAAGLAAARAIRSCDARCSISILSAEDCLAYSPAVLPYLLSGRTSEKQIYITDNAFYQENSLDLHLNKKVVGIDIKGQKVFVHDGSSLGYDRLLIATGGSPRKLVVGDQPREKLFTLRTMSDAERILNTSGSAKNIVLVGAGLVGLETSHALHKRGKNIRILAKSNQVLSRNADRQCSRIMQNRIEKEGISFLFGRDVVEIVPMKTKLLVVTDQGDSKLHVNDLMDAEQVLAITEKLKAKGKNPPLTRPAKPATFQPLLLGITKASLTTESPLEYMLIHFV